MSNMNRMNATMISVEPATVTEDVAAVAVAVAAPVAEARVNHKYNESCVQTNLRS